MFSTISLWIMQIKSRLMYLYTPIKQQEYKGIIPMLARMQRNWIFHTLFVGMYNGIATLQNSFSIPCKTNSALTIQPRNYTTGHLFQRNEDLGSQKSLYTNYQRSFICNNQKLQTTQVSLLGEWLNKLWYIRTMQNYPTIKMNELLITCVGGYERNHVE